MLKYLTVLFACIAIKTNNSFAQKIDFSISKPFRTIDAPLKYYMVKDSILLTLKIDKETSYFQKHCINNLDFLGYKEVGEAPRTEEVVYLGKFGKDFFIFYVKEIKKTDNKNLYFRQIDFKNYSYKGEEKLLPPVMGNPETSSFHKILLAIDSLDWDQTKTYKLFTKNSTLNTKASTDLVTYFLNKRISQEIGDPQAYNYNFGIDYLVPLDMGNASERFFSLNDQHMSNQYNVFRTYEYSIKEAQKGEISEHSQNKIIITEEQSKAKTVSNVNGIGSPSPTTFSVSINFKDLTVTKLDSNETIIWKTKIPKLQKVTSNSIYAINRGPGKKTFEYYRNKNELVFIFLDSQKNKDRKIEEKVSSYEIGSPGIIVMYSINDFTGSLSKRFLFDTKSTQGIKLYQITPNRFVLANNKYLIFEAYKKKNEDVLVKIRLD